MACLFKTYFIYKIMESLGDQSLGTFRTMFEINEKDEGINEGRIKQGMEG